MAKCSFFSNIFSNVQNSRSTPLRPRARRARSEQQLQPATSNSVCSAVVLLLLLAYTYMLAGALDSRASHGGVLSSVLRGMSRISGEATRSCDFAQNQECLRELYAAHTEDQVTVYESRNTDSVQSRLVQGSTGLYRACVHLSAAAWSISKATWQLTQALQLLKFPLYNLATICFMAVLGGTYQAVLLLTVAISRLSYDLLQVTYLLTVVAAQLAVLAGALTLLLLLTVLPLTAVIAAGWLLYRCLAQQGLVAHRTRAPPASAFWQSRRQNLSQLSRASRNRSRRFWLSLPSCLPVAARSSMIFRLKQMLVTADRISVWILPGKRTLCTICLEGIPQRRMVHVEGCSHSYCQPCLVTHLQTRLGNNRRNMLCCPVPGCTASFSVAQCQTALRHNKSVFEQIAELAAVALIPPDQQAVCPHTACLSIFEVEPGLAARQPRQQCPHCRRLLCLQCKTAWHSGVTCDQNLEDPNTQMLLNLARQENLARCPGCSSVVERTRGCDHMQCRCGNHFSYSAARLRQA